MLYFDCFFLLLAIPWFIVIAVSHSWVQLPDPLVVTSQTNPVSLYADTDVNVVTYRYFDPTNPLAAHASLAQASNTVYVVLAMHLVFSTTSGIGGV